MRCTSDGHAELLNKCNIQKKSREQRHGLILNTIYTTIQPWIARADVLVRERGFSRYAAETQALFKVVGITDLAAWQIREMTFDEIAPASVKKIITGSGRASKADVAASLAQYVGQQFYASDDESDATAVAVAWLIQHGFLDEE